MAQNEPSKSWLSRLSSLQNTARRVGEHAERAGRFFQNHVSRELAEENGAVNVHRNLGRRNNEPVRRLRNGAANTSFSEHAAAGAGPPVFLDAPPPPPPPVAAPPPPPTPLPSSPASMSFQLSNSNEGSLLENNYFENNYSETNSYESNSNETASNRSREAGAYPFTSIFNGIRQYFSEERPRPSLPRNNERESTLTQAQRNAFMNEFRSLEAALISIGTDRVTARKQAAQLAISKLSRNIQRQMNEESKRINDPEFLPVPRRGTRLPPPPPEPKGFVEVMCDELGRCFTGLRARTAKKKAGRKNTNRKRKTRKNNSK